MKKILLLFCFTFFALTIFGQQYIADGRLPLSVIPAEVAGFKKPVVSLDGNWEINMEPVGEVWKTKTGDPIAIGWKKIQVPGEPSMQGFKVENDKEFFYRTSINIPVSGNDKKFYIRFNGVYSYARVFVNGNFVRDHFGGFTAWEADLTPYVKPGEKAVIHVGVTDRADDISYASGYAHHPIGGILREVQLLILPAEHINRFYVQPQLSSDFKNATLHFNVANNSISNESKLRIQVFDAKGKVVSGTAKTVLFTNGEANETISIANPVLWNQEQPYLYSIRAELISGNTVTEIIEQKTGIRKVEVDGKRLLVNGKPVKLRGACRHDVHPLLGRSTNRYYDSLDVVLAKEANLNFIRTSHYPPTQDFLEFADKLGLYVQEETAICFANNWREGVYKKLGESANDTAYTSRYLGQLSEMIDRDRNHPAIIMWSIGNESDYGINFQKEYEFVKSVDLSRPVSWTWPGNALKEGKRCFDIAVTHYPAYNGKDEDNFGMRYKNMEHEHFPLLGDEWAHVACYNTTLLKSDPNVKNFWGRSLDTMWAARFDVPGNLGGAIWGMTDETFHLPDTVTGYGPWGFIDVWRRKKAEFWNTKKAYSPIKVLQTTFNSNDVSGELNLPVKNRFNHLLLNEIVLKITANGKTATQKLPPLKPHEEGIITIKSINKKTPLLLQFYDAKGNMIDEEKITWYDKNSMETIAENTKQKWQINRGNNKLELKNNNLTLIFNIANGELQKVVSGTKELLISAPRVIVNYPKEYNAFKETEGNYSGAYKVESATINTEDKSCVVITSKGMVDSFPVIVTSRYFANGTIRLEYEAQNIPKYTWQVGLAFPVNNSFNTVNWKRNGYWSTYPANHLSATEGTAKRTVNTNEQYGVKPAYEIAQGMHDYYLKQTILPAKANMGATEMYRASKENIISFNVGDGKNGILFLSKGTQAAKMQLLPYDKQEVLIIDKLDYWSLSWGNYQGSANTSSTMKGTVTLELK